MADELVVKRWVVGGIILGLFVLAFFILKPILISLTIGLLFAYVFNPVYKKLLSYTHKKTLTALLLILLIGVIVIIPLIYFTPVIINQTFETYVTIQNLDLTNVFSS